MDDADIAGEQEEAMRLEALRKVMAVKPLTYTGYCHNCQEEVEPEKRFCDGECGKDYNRRELFQRHTGVKSGADTYSEELDTEDRVPLHRSTPGNGELDAAAPRRNF